LGADRAVYGAKLYKTLAQKFKNQGIQGLSRSNLHLYKQFYFVYPQIVQTLSGQLKLPHEIAETIKTQVKPIATNSLSLDINLFINQLSFSHFIEFLTCDTPLQRALKRKLDPSVFLHTTALNTSVFKAVGILYLGVFFVRRRSGGADFSIFKNGA
jgi:DUF1016 N-terminal domain